MKYVTGVCEVDRFVNQDYHSQQYDPHRAEIKHRIIRARFVHVAGPWKHGSLEERNKSGTSTALTVGTGALWSSWN